MIDWVMPPQTVVAIYIYRVGRSCPARNPFPARNSQGLLNSARTRGPPVRPTGQTGVAVTGSTTRRSTGLTGGVSLIGLVPNLGANSDIHIFTNTNSDSNILECECKTNSLNSNSHLDIYSICIIAILHLFMDGFRRTKSLKG
jgi:hypothetical protein